MALNQSEAFGDQDFDMFKRKIKASYGLDLDAYKRPQMERRLRANMEKCGAQTFLQYYTLIEKNAVMRDEFMDRVTINVSEFFRNPDQFDVLASRVMPELLARSSSLNIWSAGCSCGAEAYTLAIMLREMNPIGRHTIIATDIDDRMLERGQKGVYQEHEIRCVSKARLAKYFKSGPDGYTADPSLKTMISFRKQDLLLGQFRTGIDLILCRNVVIYFTDEAKASLYRRFFQSLRPGGYLFVGGTERIADYLEIGYENPIPFFYRKPERH